MEGDTALVASCSWEIEDEQLKTRISVAYLTSLLEVDQEGQPNLTEAKLEEALDRFKRIAPKENGPVHLSHSFFLSTAMIVQASVGDEMEKMGFGARKMTFPNR